MTADGPNDPDPCSLDPFPEILGRTQPVGQVVLVQDLIQADGKSFQVAPRQPTVGGKPLGNHHQLRTASASAESRMARNPPIFPNASFFALIRTPSQRENIWRAISRTLLSWQPLSRFLMKNAFSANRAASRKRGTRRGWRMRRTLRMFSIEMGCPPTELLVAVRMTRRTRWELISRRCLRASRSIFPLKGASNWVSAVSAQGRSTASAPECSMFARVVSKWVLPMTRSPFDSLRACMRRNSADRPWCVGMTFSMPVSSCTTFSNLWKLGEPAYDSSPIMIPAHCRALMAEVPESVRRSNVTSWAGTLNRLYPAAWTTRARSEALRNRIGSTDLMRNGSLIVLARGRSSISGCLLGGDLL